MSAPVKPIKLDPASSYIHISAPLDPKTIEQTAASQNIHLQHKGPIGELEGEHIFEVLSSGRAAVARDTDAGKDVIMQALSGLKGADGIKDAKVMESKQRAKR